MREKSNKNESEMALRQISILHKMLEQTAILLTQKFKNSLQSKATQSANQVINKKVQFLNQSLILSKWISSMDSESVNDCFDDAQNKVPRQLVEYDSFYNEDMKSVAAMQLSPNNMNVNDSIKGHTMTILGQHKASKLGKNSGVFRSVSRAKNRSALSQSVNGPVLDIYRKQGS